ncbi:hypothetical protein [Paenibacillus sp. TH7-28]
MAARQDVFLTKFQKADPEICLILGEIGTMKWTRPNGKDENIA